MSDDVLCAQIEFNLMSENQHHRHASGAGNHSALVRTGSHFHHFESQTVFFFNKAWEFPNAQH